MRPLLVVVLLLASITFAGCGAAEGNRAPQHSDVNGVADTDAQRTTNVAEPKEQPAPGRTTYDGDANPAARTQNVSLQQADQSKSEPAPAPAQRKIIRNAELTIETDVPADAARKVGALAESRGGFVVTSESRQQGGYDNAKPYEVVTVQVRVPASEFDAVVAEILKVGGRVVEEKKTGQDVTEEYIDLEARIRTQRALEAQFLEIMKTANRVSDALEVQRELANVRTEIERLEGRRRFLENQTSLSTIKVTLRPPGPLVSASGFGHGVRDAFGDGIDAAATIVLVLIRVAIALIPILLFIILPLALLIRFLIRRLRRRKTVLT